VEQQALSEQRCAKRPLVAGAQFGSGSEPVPHRYPTRSPPVTP
jgi:hypothetical protein